MFAAFHERKGEKLLMGIRLRFFRNKMSDMLFFSVFVLAYRLLLDASYYSILSKVYVYYGFINNISPP